MLRPRPEHRFSRGHGRDDRRTSDRRSSVRPHRARRNGDLASQAPRLLAGVDRRDHRLRTPSSLPGCDDQRRFRLDEARPSFRGEGRRHGDARQVRVPVTPGTTRSAGRPGVSRTVHAPVPRRASADAQRDRGGRRLATVPLSPDSHRPGAVSFRHPGAGGWRCQPQCPVEPVRHPAIAVVTVPAPLPARVGQRPLRNRVSRTSLGASAEAST